LALLCIHKGFYFGQTLFREFTNEIVTDKDAFETITIKTWHVCTQKKYQLLHRLAHM
jgi:hypothetical protein